MAAERQLIADHDLPDIEALVVGHHGSKSSTSKELLEALTPETGIISVGDNSYGHPTEDALRRLVLADVEIYRTDKQGTVQGQRGLSETEKRPGRGNGGERLHLLRGGDVSPGVLSQRAAEEAGPRRV